MYRWKLMKKRKDEPLSLVLYLHNKITKAIQECGLNQEVLHVLCHSIEVLPEEIQERYEALMGKHIKNSENKVEISSEPEIKQLLDKTLNAALDSFDNLFCRRCLIFDCRLHGCSQNLITVSEKLPYGSDPDENRKPCSKHCYLNRRENKEGLFSAEKDSNQTNKTESASPSEHEDSNCDDDITRVTPSDGLCSDVNKLTIVSSETVGSMLAHATISSCAIERNIPVVPLKNLVNVGKRKNLKHGVFSSGKPHIFQKSVGPADKKQKKLSLYDTFQASKKLEKLYSNIISNPDTKTHGWAANCIQLPHESKEYPFQTQDGHSKNHGADIQDTKIHKITEVSLLKSLSSSSRKQASGWSLFEKDLYLKGVEIFGKNSCLIARNLLSGLKTCIEVSKYMFNDGASLQTGPLFTSSYLDDIGGCDPAMTEHDTPARTKIWRKRGRAKKLKYTWKSAGHPSIRKRIGDGKPQPCKQYIPCGCWQMCGKQCSCLENGTCCEKYCGCSKSCKNRFRGCHCAKSQCRSRQCPCFAAGRECDPDVCRNCWVSCGDGSVDEPQSAGDSYQCGNMKLLLRQQQRILLARSDVAGWGAFIRNPVNKNDYLGEYTGELVSHKEADKRGKIYDRANSSFLFDLNDQFVLDAYRKGDKLKFANHSSNPNCYAKVMLVAGDHRVGIYAKEHIEAGEELFYDYRYGLDQAPAWARKPEGSKRDDPTHSLCRAKKIALPCHELL